MTVFSGGDWVVFFNNAVSQLHFYPYIWGSVNGNGFGQNIVFVLGYKFFFSVFAKFLLNVLSFPWPVSEKLLFFIPFWTLSLYSSFSLGAYFFKKNLLRILTVLIFSFNTYALMLVGGGQMGVALAYALSPLSFVFFLKTIEKEKIQNFLVLGVLLSFQIILDIRIGIIVLFLIFFFLLYQFFLKRLSKKMFFNIIPSLVVLFLLNLFWILPLIFVRQISLAPAYTSSSMVKFLSFATLENSISLLHPNWPENIFGKVYFLRAEFLLIPILAFACLLFFNAFEKKQKRYILFFSIVSIVGVFLSKGANDPFGSFYLFLSDKIPGFTMFRDSTKFYLLIVISYAVLIPYSIESLSKKFRVNQKMVIAIFIIIWALTIRQLFLGQLTGTFKAKVVSEEYLKLQSLILKDNAFYRTFWIPTTQRFGYFANNNPAISAYDFYNVYSAEDILKKLQNSEKLLNKGAVRYIIVPFDSEGEIFLDDRKYSEKEYQETISGVRKIPWLEEVRGFEKIKVFKLTDSKDHFWLGNDASVSYKQINPVEYKISLRNVKKGEILFFSEAFDSNWVASNERVSISSRKQDLFNSFLLPMDGDYELKIYYKPQKYVNIGLAISGITLASVVLLIGFGYARKKW